MPEKNREQYVLDEKLKLLWTRRHHQDNLVHTRVGLMIMIQSFLLISFGNLIGQETNVSYALASAIAVTGLFSTILMLTSIVVGINTFYKFREEIRNMKHEISTDLKRSATGISFSGFLGAYAVPIIFIFLWIVSLGCVMYLIYLSFTQSPA